MSAPGWFPDPTGRFGQRWYDGTDWTAAAIGASGAVVQDPLAQAGPAPGQPAGSPIATAGPGHEPHPAGTPAAQYGPGVGLLVSLLGLVCVLLSLFVLDWTDGNKGTFLDLGTAVRQAGSAAVDDQGIYLYAAWAGFVLFGVTVVLVLLAGVPLPRSRAGNTYARILGALVAGAAAVLQSVAVVHVFRGPADPQFGAWLGIGGYLIVIVGLVFGARRRTG